MGEALSRLGIPAEKTRVSKWEAGVDPNDDRLIVIPAYVMQAVARIAGRSLAQLLLMVGAEDQDPLAAQVAGLQRRVDDLEARIEGWEEEWAREAVGGDAKPDLEKWYSERLAELERAVEELRTHHQA